MTAGVVRRHWVCWINCGVVRVWWYGHVYMRVCRRRPRMVRCGYARSHVDRRSVLGEDWLLRRSRLIRTRRILLDDFLKLKVIFVSYSFLAQRFQIQLGGLFIREETLPRICICILHSLLAAKLPPLLWSIVAWLLVFDQARLREYCLLVFLRHFCWIVLECQRLLRDRPSAIVFVTRALLGLHVSQSTRERWLLHQQVSSLAGSGSCSLANILLFLGFVSHLLF